MSSLLSNVNIGCKKEIGKMTANMYMMRYYISLQGFINYMSSTLRTYGLSPVLCSSHNIMSIMLSSEGFNLQIPVGPSAFFFDHCIMTALNGLHTFWRWVEQATVSYGSSFSFRQLDPTEVTITYSWSHILSYWMLNTSQSIHEWTHSNSWDGMRLKLTLLWYSNVMRMRLLDWLD